MNKTVGSTLLVAGTMIGAGMLAMPLTSAGIGLTATVFLLIGLWAVLTFTALLFVELYQTADSDAGIGTLAAQYFGKTGRIISTAVLIVFLYALIAAYVSGGGSLLMDLLPAMGDKDTMNKIAVLVFTIFFGSFIVIGTHSVDKINRVLFFVMDSEGTEMPGATEQKAANLLYLVVKDHPLVDGNKRVLQPYSSSF